MPLAAILLQQGAHNHGGENGTQELSKKVRIKIEEMNKPDNFLKTIRTCTKQIETRKPTLQQEE